MIRTYGYVHDSTDTRDYKAYGLVKKEAPLPRKFCWPWLFYDQDGEAACTCAGKSGVKSVHEFRQSGKWIRFGWLELYRKIKEIDNIPEPGSMPRIVHKFVKENGMYLPGGAQPVKEYKIDGYWRIYSWDSVELIKQLIFQMGPIEVGSMWYKSWEAEFLLFPKPDRPAGGHLYVTPGWDDELGGFIIANSWQDWGKYKPEGMPGPVSMSIMGYDMFRMVVQPEGDIWKLQDHTTQLKECWLKKIFA